MTDDENAPRPAANLPEWEIEEMVRDVIGQTMRANIGAVDPLRINPKTAKALGNPHVPGVSVQRNGARMTAEEALERYRRDLPFFSARSPAISIFPSCVARIWCAGAMSEGHVTLTCYWTSQTEIN